MKISLVVPAFNEERLLGESLAQIQAASWVFTQRGWVVELIVCDNNSTDRTAEIAHAAGAMVVFDPVNQIARARNTGAAAGTGDWLIFVDADSYPSRELFDEVAEQILSGQCFAGGVTIRHDEENFFVTAITHFWNWLSRLGRLMAGSFIFVEAAVFRQVGGFSHELFAAEELDLSNRLKKLVRSPHRKLVILHRHPLRTSARKMRLYTPREMFAFLLRLTFNHRSILRSREFAHFWYDGRR